VSAHRDDSASFGFGDDGLGFPQFRSQGERKYHAAIPAIIVGIAFGFLAATHSAFFSVLLWSFVAMGIWSFQGPFWSLASEFLTGFSAASGIALITSVGILGGFVGPYAFGFISQRTGNTHGGLVGAGVSVLVSAILMLVLPINARALSAAKD
jgi:MFS transporter, ACS family, tartrate transporter